MGLKKIKKCGACKAFNYGNCELGFNMKPILIFDAYVNGTPLELCPKPTTTSDFVDCLQNQITNKTINQQSIE